jgi:hypothetical protein
MKITADWFLKKDNIQLLLVVVLSIVLIVVFKNRMSGGKDIEKAAASPVTHNTAPGTPVTVQDKALKSEAVDSKSLKASELKAPPSMKRDIFSFRISENSSKREVVKSGPDLKLNATITDDGEPLAIIGSEVLGIGEMVKGFTVITINNNEAVLLRNGKHYTLRMIDQ